VSRFKKQNKKTKTKYYNDYITRLTFLFFADRWTSIARAYRGVWSSRAHGQHDVVQDIGLGQQDDGLRSQVAAERVDGGQQRPVVRQQISSKRLDDGHVAGTAQQRRRRRVRLQRPVVVSDGRPVLQHPFHVVGTAAPQPAILVDHGRRIVPRATDAGARRSGQPDVVTEQVHRGHGGRLGLSGVRHVTATTDYNLYYTVVKHNDD